MKKPYVIGICGQAGAGKDTFAAALLETLADYHLTGKKYSFADPLKQACEVLFGGDGIDHWYTQEGKAAAFPFWADELGDKYASGRKILVTVGTDVCRYHIDQDFWLKVATWRLMHESVDVIVVPDVRFDNEANWIREAGGVVIQVINTNQTQLRPAGSLVRRLRKLPVLGTSNLLSNVLMRAGYASHASEDGISVRYVTAVCRSDAAIDTRRWGSAAAVDAWRKITK